MPQERAANGLRGLGGRSSTRPRWTQAWVVKPGCAGPTPGQWEPDLCGWGRLSSFFQTLPGDLSQCAVGVRTPQSRQTSGFKIYLISVFQRNLQSPGKSILRQTKQINRYPHGQLYSVKDYLLHIYGKPRTVLSAMKYPWKYPPPSSVWPYSLKKIKAIVSGLNKVKD